MYTAEELDAVRWYTGSGFEVNEWLATNEDAIWNYQWEYIKNLDSAISKTEVGDEDNQPVLYRGVGAYALGVDEDSDLEYMDKASAVKYINENLIGNEFVNKGYTSVSLSDSKAQDFGEFILRFQGIRKDVKGMAVSGQGTSDKAFSSFGTSEHEIILERGFAYMITGAEYHNGVVYVDVIGY